MCVKRKGWSSVTLVTFSVIMVVMMMATKRHYRTQQAKKRDERQGDGI